MRNPKFKPGDKVRCVDNAHASKIMSIGDLGEVAYPAYTHDGGRAWLMVKLDSELHPRGWLESRWKHAGGNLMPDTRDYLNVLSEVPTDP